MSENSVTERLIERLRNIEAKYAELEKEYKRCRGERRKALFNELIKLKKMWKSVKRQLHDHFKPLILKRDNYKCRACGLSENLELARLYEDSLALLNRPREEQELFRYSGPYRTVEERYAPENMFILCKKCHRRFDSLTGRFSRMGSNAISSVEEAICILRKRDLFDKPPFPINHVKYYTESAFLTSFKTLFKVLRKASIFSNQGDLKKTRFYLGLVKREWNFLSDKLPDDLRVKIESLIGDIRSAYTNEEIEKLERNLRQIIIEYLERNIRSDHLAKFKRAIFEQDKSLENKALMKKLK